MVGQNIGKYRVLDRVGRGGMGTVYRAIDETLHREVAIKVLNAELNDPEVAKRFRAEAITVARLSHPGIATIYELFQHDGQWLMVMEFVRGETLERLIERAGPQTPERAAELCMHSLAALAHAHSMGVVHRDLKPANVMLTENGVIKIMDFGIARVAGTEHLTNAGFMMGTPAYMAPEQVLGHETDARADLYAMGVVFYRLLTGQLPFKGDTPFAMAQAQVNNPPTPVGTFRQGLPAWVDEVMSRSLAKKPDDRFQSAVEFHEVFSRSLGGQPGSAAYRSPASTGSMMTAPNPTLAGPGTIAQTMLSTPRGGTSVHPAAQSGAIHHEHSEAGPTIAAATPASLARPVLSPSGAHEVIAQSGAQRSDLFGSGSHPVASGSSASIPAAAASGAIPSAAPETSGRFESVAAFESASPRETPVKKSSTGLIAVAAVLMAVGSIGAFMMMRRPPAPVVAEAPADAAATPGVETATSQPVAEPTPPPTTPAAPAAPVAPSPDASANATVPPGSTPATAGAGRSATPAAGMTSGAARGAAAPPVADESLLVNNVRVLVVNGKKANDQEIVLNFGNGQIALVNTRSGTPVATMPYRSIAGATYVHARDPRWNPALASPPEGLDVGSMLRTSKHYLTLQGKDGYQILRLEDANVIRVLQAVEARAGITIDRPRSGDRN